MQNLNEIEELIKIISKLPGLGPKSAKRIILKLISNRDELLKPMAKVLVDIYKNVSRCNICGTLKSKNECQNCKSSNNKRKSICIVEDIADQWSIESSNIFDGYFFAKFNDRTESSIEEEVLIKIRIFELNALSITSSLSSSKLLSRRLTPIST